jgi:AcrR family transcriptional regulator
MTRPPRGRTSGAAAANGSGKITREMVLAAALEIIDADGADGLSMRRLARALGRDPMILYRHAPNKAALLDGVAETILAQLHVDPADPDWAAQLRTVARDYRAARAGPPERRAAAGHPPPGHPARAAPPRHLAPARGHPGPAHPRRVHRTPTPCTSTGPCSDSCTATSSTNCRNSSRTRTRPTTCCGWACTGCRSANSPCCAASPPPWPPTTAPPNSNAASTSSSPGSPPP